MTIKQLIAALPIACSLFLSSCSVPSVERFGRSEGLLSALSGPEFSTTDVIPVQSFSSSRACIYTSFVDQTASGLVVHGLVRRVGPINPGSNSHIEYEVRNASGKVIEQGTAYYYPREIPPMLPGHVPQSKFWIQLRTTNPPPGSKVCLYLRD